MIKKIIIFIITTIILIFIVRGCVINHQKSDQNTKTTTNSVNYYCKEGELKVDFINNKNSTSTVKITFSNGSSISLPQTISASGMHYELGSTTFVGKGDNAILTQDGIDTYTSCITGDLKINNENSTFTDTSKTFSISFPNEFILFGGEIGYSQNWAQQSTSTGLLLVNISTPENYMPKTNFSDAKFTVGVSTDPDAIKNCLTYNLGNLITSTKVKIGGNEFTKINFSDAGAGNFYDTTSYRILHNDSCYAIEYTIHSTNIGNYSPDQGITEFDKTKITEILENIVQNFRFL